MEATDKPLSSELLATPLRNQRKTPIAQLAPTLDDLDNRCIVATVSLIWPYSSFQKCLSLLLAEPDSRLRWPNGQVKAIFHGRVAESVAEQRVGIGETVCLSLKHGRLVSKENASQTPQKGVPWDLHFDDGVMLEVNRTSQNAPSLSVTVQPSALPEIEPPSTPQSHSVDRDSGPVALRGLWGSPAFHKSSRKSSGSAVDSMFDPFIEEDGYVPGKGRKRPRYSLQRNEWRVVNEPSSPPELDGEVDWEKSLEDEMEIEFRADQTEDTPAPTFTATAFSTASPAASNVEETNPASAGVQPGVNDSFVFAKPHFDIGRVSSIRPSLQESDRNSAMSPSEGLESLPTAPVATPQLRPVPSPGLPIPSPFPSDQHHSQDYFATIHTAPPAQHLHGSFEPSSEVTAEERGLHEKELHTQMPYGSTDHGEESKDSTYEDFPSSSWHQAKDEEQIPRSFLQESVTSACEETPEILMDPLLSQSPEIESSDLVNRDMQLEAGDELRAGVTSEEVEDPASQKHEEVLVEHMKAQELPQVQARDTETDITNVLTHMQPGSDQVHGDTETREVIADEISLRPEIKRFAEAAVMYTPRQHRRDGLRANEADDASLEDEDEDEDAEAESWQIDQDKYAIPTPMDENAKHAVDSMDEDEDADADSFSASELYEDEYDSEEDMHEDQESDDKEITRQQPAGSPDVIVLDSDSEYEDRPQRTTADAPVSTPSRSVDLERSSPSHASRATMDSQRSMTYKRGIYSGHGTSESEVTSDQDSEDFDSEGDEDEELPYVENERVRDSDLDDESSSGDDVQGDNHERVKLVDDAAQQTIGRAPAEVIEEDSSAQFAGLEKFEEDEEKGRLEGEHEDLGEDDVEESEVVEVGVERDEVVEDHDEDDEENIHGPEEKEMEKDMVLGTDSRFTSINETFSSTGEFMRPEAPQEEEADVLVEVTKERPEGTLTSLLGADSAQDWEVSVDPQEGQMSSRGSLSGFVEAEVTMLEKNEISVFKDTEQVITEDIAGIVASVSDPVSTEQLLSPDFTQDVIIEKEVDTENERSRGASSSEKPLPADSNELHAAPLAVFDGEAITQEQDKLALKPDVDEVDEETPPSSPTRSLPSSEIHEDTMQTDEPQASSTEPLPDAPQTPVVVVRKASLPDREAQGLRSKLSYFAPLASLADHYNALVDTISVVYEYSPIAKATSGARDYYMSIFLTDPSMAGTTLEARIFRRYKSAIPTVTEGDAILLRDFKVQSHQHSMVLISVDSSAWAVFAHTGSEPTINGPPVEYGSEESDFASDLRRWYVEDGAGMVADNRLQASIAIESRSRTPSSATASEVGSQDGTPSARSSRRSRRSHRQVIIHELRDGTRYTEIGSPSGQHGIHELRDGTVYVNE
ncbi:hypothetical protein N7539_000387 [Penicillium diatomitis]|uniref:Telomeric single stranded DNA binding POT1/Cdc13 domain-containing protein n=1 Tax=Penicillium diatomitis TaxID=2819901 RepID=A0A9W9XLN2_9EURO|nr:uncharacterized protein N7539_000387 [Penicillium diatomitis]KAJ5495271.1 hypothetical protein N7539_000387 [Penicillium diatomitis]